MSPAFNLTIKTKKVIHNRIYDNFHFKEELSMKELLMEIDVTWLVEIVFTAIGLLISTYLIPWLRSKKSEQELNELNNWVKIAVSAAEQMYNAGGQGVAKKQFVFDWLKARNIKFDEERLDALIEAAVFNLKNHGLLAEVVDIEENAKG